MAEQLHSHGVLRTVLECQGEAFSSESRPRRIRVEAQGAQPEEWRGELCSGQRPLSDCEDKGCEEAGLTPARLQAQVGEGGFPFLIAGKLTMERAAGRGTDHALASSADSEGGGEHLLVLDLKQQLNTVELGEGSNLQGAAGERKPQGGNL